MAVKLDVQKRQHRERGQTQKRQRLGLLEKHKDYVKRARDYHSKQDRLKRLREKAAARNKDEFYFGMLRSRTEGGVHVQGRGNRPLETDLVRLLKTQDAGYIRMQRAIEEKVRRIRCHCLAAIDLMRWTQRVSRLKEQIGLGLELSRAQVDEEISPTDVVNATPNARLLQLLQTGDRAVQASPADSTDTQQQPQRSRVRFVDSAKEGALQFQILHHMSLIWSAPTRSPKLCREDSSFG